MSDRLPKPIYDVDISLPASQLVQSVRDQLAEARGRLDDIAHFLGWAEHLKDVQGLLTCGIVALAFTCDQMIAAEGQIADCPRCEVCGWPLAEGRGCEPGNCSYRPDHGTPEWWRIQKRRAVLAAREAAKAAIVPDAKKESA